MPVTINASPTNGLVQTADGSGIVKLQSNGVATNALAWGSYAFVASLSAPSLRSAYNISSITRNGAGDYTFTFTTALSDANYVTVTTPTYVTTQSVIGFPVARTTTTVRIYVGYVTSLGGAETLYDYGVDFAVFGN
jgi:hypothetical protein